MAKIGTVSVTRKGNDAKFECTCGASEEVVNYENGAKPKKFEWRITSTTEHSSCSSCKSEHNSNIGERFK